MSKTIVDDVIKSFVEKWGESALNPDVNQGVEFAVEFINKQQSPLDDELVDEIACACLDWMVKSYKKEIEPGTLKKKIRKILQSRQPGKPKITRTEIKDVIQACFLGNYDKPSIELFKSLGFEVVEK